MKTIAVIDDDAYIGDLLEEVLTKEGYGVLRAYSGTEALYLLSEKRPDLVLLDLMLPGLSGEEVLKKIRDLPVIVLSARGDVQNKVEVLLDGAADYLTKPFDVRELLARITVQLRTGVRRTEQGVLKFTDILLDQDTHEVLVQGKPVRLTKTEYAILKLLLNHPRQVVTKSVILERIAEDTPDCTEGSLKQHVSNLRGKLRKAGNREYIESVWGIGFKMAENID